VGVLSGAQKSPGHEGLGFLFADAEVRKDVAQNVVGVHCSCDFSEVMKGQPGIHGDKVSGHVLGQAVPHRLEGLLGRGQSLKVPQIGHDELVAVVVGAVLLQEFVPQGAHSCSRGCTQFDGRQAKG
jgi:hypothetical protein